MALPNQRELRSGFNKLQPVTRDVAHDKARVREVVRLVERHADVLEAQLPGIVGAYSSVRKARKRLERIAESETGEAYLVLEYGGLVGNSTVLLKTPEALEGASAQIDYWIPGAQYHRITGQEIGRLLIQRGIEVAGSAHAWLVDNDMREPSRELKEYMTPVGAPTTGFMVGDADRNADPRTAARLYVAKSTLA